MAISNFENAISIHQETSLSIERKKKNIVGQTIEQVQYVISDYKERPYQYDGFHLIDTAICIRLSNEQWINWVWLEDDPTVEYCYHLYYEDARDAINNREQEGIDFLVRSGLYTPDSHSKGIDVSTSDDWKEFIGQKIEDINFLTQKIDGIPFLSDVILSFKHKTVRIIAMDEPEPDALPEITSIDFDPVWTMVVFNDAILKTHNRL
ncbi:MAG: hypothetical protein AB8B65_13210 [Kordia sp.]|uniref:hypothetical protein n=1 Tax=Kordia sp. TaxID=1965332 RepID=UPI00385FCC4E